MRIRTKREKFLRAAALAVGSGLVFSLFVTPAFTASNSVSESRRGEGAGEISGYAVTEVHYNVNATNPGNIDSVTFRLDSAPTARSTVKVKLLSDGTDWYTCSLTESPAVDASCPTTSPQATVTESDEFRVIVTD
jgi:hypothetical protein